MGDAGFFEMREKLVKPKGRAGQRPVTATQSNDAKPLTVSQLTQVIDKAIKAGVPAQVSVKAEASNFKLHGGSGHAYFTLKDAKACIDCVMFRDAAATLKFTPEDGMELIATGRVAVYPARGRYQLYVTHLEPVGQGALELAFRQLCAKLEKEGLFAPERKRPLPAYPRRVALLTSTETAAVQDMFKVLRRYPWMKVLVYHVPVQGDGAAERIAGAIAHLNLIAPRVGGVDVILLARGGGSLEDLWAFNVECVARAIVSSRIPIITGIGHEIDVSIADLAADYHAHTPTEAAQVVVAQWRGVRELLDVSGGRLRRALRGAFQEARQRLITIERHDFFRRPVQRIQQMQQMIDDRQRGLLLAVMQRLQKAKMHIAGEETRLQQRHPRHVMRLMHQRLDFSRQQLTQRVGERLARQRLLIDGLDKRLEAVSPQQVLRRGYTMTFGKKDGKLIRTATALKPGDKLLTRFVDGQVESTVEDTRQLKLFE